MSWINNTLHRWPSMCNLHICVSFISRFLSERGFRLILAGQMQHHWLEDDYWIRGPTRSASALSEILNGSLCAAQGRIDVCSSSHRHSAEHHCVPRKFSPVLKYPWHCQVCLSMPQPPHEPCSIWKEEQKEAERTWTCVGVPAAKTELIAGSSYISALLFHLPCL